MKRILIATDGSDEGAKAVALGADLAGHYDAALIVVHIVPNPVLGTYAVFPIPDTVKEIQAKDAEHAFDQAKGILDKTGVSYKTVTKKGSPADEILAAADESSVDAIVMGRRGLGKARRWLLGSVSDRVAHGSKCTVILAGPADDDGVDSQ